MSQTPIQELQIENEISEWSLRIDAMNRGLQGGLGRLNKLKEHELFLEYLLVDVQLVEQNIKFILAGFATKRRILHILGEHDPFAEYKLAYTDEEPLGSLTGILRNFTGKTTLIERLGRLNVLRKEIVHHLFDGLRDVKAVEIKAALFIKDEVPNLILELKEVALKVNKEITEIAEKSKNT